MFKIWLHSFCSSSLKQSYPSLLARYRHSLQSFDPQFYLDQSGLTKLALNLKIKIE